MTAFNVCKDEYKDKNVLKNRILQNYWEESGSVDFIKDLFKKPLISSKIGQLINDAPIFFVLKKQIISDHFKKL